MKSLTILLLGVALASTGCSKTVRASAGAPGSADGSAQTSADDQQNLQGTWKMERAMFNGQPIMNDVRWIFDGDHLTIVLKGNYADSVRPEFQLGTGDRPNTILIKFFNNPLANQGYYGGSYTGIYKVSGDKLRVCYDLTGRQYPNSFDAGKGSLRMSYEFTREKTEQHADGA